MNKPLLEIPADQSRITVKDERGELVFSGDDMQALRVSNIVPPIIGGDTHRVYLEAGIERDHADIIVKAHYDFDLDAYLEIRIRQDSIKQISVCWPT
jgi:hypothetical protein